MKNLIILICLALLSNISYTQTWIKVINTSGEAKCQIFIDFSLPDKTTIEDLVSYKDCDNYLQGNYSLQMFIPCGYSFDSPNGEIEGNFSNGKLEGYVKWYGYGYLDKKFEGNYKNGYRNGYGTLSYAESGKKIYEGEWKNGKMNGTGTYYYTNGNKFVGEWVNNEKYNGTLYFKSGTTEKWQYGSKVVNEEPKTVYKEKETTSKTTRYILQLTKIVCLDQEEYGFCDEVYLKAGSTKSPAPVGMSETGDPCPSSYVLNETFTTFTNSITIELWEDDYSDDDKLGTCTIYSWEAQKSGTRKCEFVGGGAHYILYYEVYKDE